MFYIDKPYSYRNGKRALILSSSVDSELYPICSVSAYFSGSPIFTHTIDGFTHVQPKNGERISEWDLINIDDEKELILTTGYVSGHSQR